MLPQGAAYSGSEGLGGGIMQPASVNADAGIFGLDETRGDATLASG
jgi:hypothetical protein